MRKGKKAQVSAYAAVCLIALVLFSLPACRYQPKTGKNPPWIPPPQDRPSGPAAEINERLGRGINLGNALEAPSIGGWGVVLEAEYFSLIKEKGFSSVRIPIRWSAHAQANPPYTIDEDFRNYVDWAIGEALKNDLCAIINFHHYDELFTNPLGERERFLAMWRQIAEHYHDCPDSLVFEILNEPHDQLTAELWNQLLAETLAVIRETNPDRTVMIGTAEWGGAGALSKLVLPADDYLILTVHFYSPFQFTHQGADWTAGSEAWLGTAWNGSFFEKRALMDELYPVYYYSCANNIPVNVGEFGAYKEADMASRARWTEFCARMFEDYGFSWHYWEFCSGFGIYDSKDKVFHNELVNALISDDTTVLELGEPAATGAEMLVNGDFSAGRNNWSYGAWYNPYQATFNVVNGELVVDVTTAGSEGWAIQLLQGSISLEKNNRYLLSFEAWSDYPRSFSAGIGAEIERNGKKDYPSYGSASVFVTPEKRRFYILGTAGETVQTGRVDFSFGNETGRVYLDNISLKKILE